MLKDAEDTFVEEEIIDEESSELYCAACGLLAAGLGADAPPSKKGGVLGFLARKKRRSDPVPLPSAERRLQCHLRTIAPGACAMWSSFWALRSANRARKRSSIAKHALQL